MSTYEIFGKGDPLLFIHGALVNMSMWRHQIDFFSKDYQVICMDLPAHGENPDIYGKYTISKLTDNVIQTLDSLEVAATHVCGHSLGGMVAQELAVSHPNRVKKLVLAETAFGTRNSLLERIQTVFAKSFLALTPQKAIVNLSVKKYGSISISVGEFIKQEMSKYNHKTCMRVMSAAFSFSGRDQLKDIKASTLVIVAGENKQTHNQARFMSQNIPEARFEILPQASHILNMDNPEEFNRIVSSFIA